MFERKLFDYKGLEVKISDYANEGILEILNHAVQGSEGGLRFSLQNIAPRIEAYKDQIRFVSLYKKKSDYRNSRILFSDIRTGETALSVIISEISCLSVNLSVRSDLEKTKEGLNKT